jgi:membrane-associated phospholipid phosphatase
MISALDNTLFYWVNTGLSNAFFDFLMPVLRNKYTWIPFYVFMVSFFFFNFGKKAYWIVLFTILTVSTADLIGNHGFKKNFKRLRPCNAELTVPVIERIPCGSGYSFTSNHAANHFAMATFFALFFGYQRKKVFYALYTWAFLIGFAQVYVGLHYPFDILGGGLLGILSGSFYYSLYDRWIEKSVIINKAA